MKTEELIEELKTYTNLEGTEIGDYCQGLIDLRGYNDSYGMSDVFSKCLDAELMTQLKMFRERTTIVTLIETPAPYSYQELKWLEERE